MPDKHDLPKKKTHGKNISYRMVQEINEKETVISKLEARHNSHASISCGSSSGALFHSTPYVQDFISKCVKFKKVQEKRKSIITTSPAELDFTINEENFNQFVTYFFQKKLIKSDLMKFFKNKNTEIIIKKICKFIFNAVFHSNDYNSISFEYLLDVHCHLNISNQDYDTYKGLFIISMRENRFPEKEIQLFIAKLEGFRPYIVKQLKFEDVNTLKILTFDSFLLQIHEYVKNNGLLSYLYDNLDDEVSINYYRKLFNFICTGYNKTYFDPNNLQFLKEIHNKEGFNWRQCFELKNIFMNTLSDRKCLTFGEDFGRFALNLQDLHKFLLNEPNSYQPGSKHYSVKLESLISNFSNLLIRNKILSRLLGSWTPKRMEDHCKYMVEYLTNAPDNVYKLSDIAPTHSCCFVTSKEFNAVSYTLLTTLIQMKCNKEEISRLMVDLERTRHFISREKTLDEKIGEIANMTDHFIETIYINLFGSFDTKHFFLNTDAEYIKYKQKLFFLKVFRNEITSVDLIDLKAIHWKMGVKQKHFDLFLKFSNDFLVESKLESVYVKIILEKLKGFMDFICVDSKLI